MKKLIGAQLQIEMPEESQLEPNTNINHTTIGVDFAGIGETDKEIKVLIVGGDNWAQGFAEMARRAHELNKDAIVLLPPEGVDILSGKHDPFKKQPIPITPMAPLREVFIEKDNKPWYSRYQNKRGKKRK